MTLGGKPVCAYCNSSHIHFNRVTGTSQPNWLSASVLCEDCGKIDQVLVEDQEMLRLVYEFLPVLRGAVKPNRHAQKVLQFKKFIDGDDPGAA